MRQAIPVGVAIIALLLCLGAPFLGIKWGFPDDRVLPASLSAREVGDQLRNDFAVDSARNVTVVIPDASGVTPADLEPLRRGPVPVPDVSSVSSPGGHSSTVHRGTAVGRNRIEGWQRVPDRRQHCTAVLRRVRDQLDRLRR
jgi:uncharacterized membrane protein YdfJ with MMPL/SSD domain